MASRRRRGLLVALLLALMSVGPAGLLVAHASQMPGGGAAIPIAGFDDIAATTDAQMKGGAGRTTSYIMFAGAFLSLITTNVLPALLLGAGSVGMAFVPRTISGLYDAVPAATPEGMRDLASLLEPTYLSAWWTVLTAPLTYAAMLAVKYLATPVFLVPMVLAVLLVALARPVSQARLGRR